MTRYCVYISFLCIMYRKYVTMSSIAHCVIIWMIWKVVFTLRNFSAIFGR